MALATVRIDKDKLIRYFIDGFEQSLPKGMKLYEVQGRKIFEIRSSHGDLQADTRISYIVAKQGKNWFKYAIEYSTVEKIEDIVRKFIDAADIFRVMLDKERAVSFNPDGGDLGRARNNFHVN